MFLVYVDLTVHGKKNIQQQSRNRKRRDTFVQTPKNKKNLKSLIYKFILRIFVYYLCLYMCNIFNIVYFKAQKKHNKMTQNSELRIEINRKSSTVWECNLFIVIDFIFFSFSFRIQKCFKVQTQHFIFLFAFAFGLKIWQFIFHFKNRSNLTEKFFKNSCKILFSVLNYIYK